MKRDFDEARLTAYVLDELDDRERQEVEEMLAGSAELRQEVEEIRKAVGHLEGAFATEEPHALTGAQRKVVETRAGIRRWRFPVPYRWVGVAAAACLVVAVILRWDTPLLEELPWPAVIVDQELPGSQGADRDPAASSSGSGQGREGNERPGAGAPAPAVLDQTPPQPGNDEESAGELSAPGKQSGQVAGMVRDATGAGLPGAEVRLTKDGREENGTVTDDRGRFQLAQVKPGEYELESKMPGFRVSKEQLEVRPGSRVEQDMEMEVGQVTETITVAAAPPQILITPAVGGVPGGVVGGVVPGRGKMEFASAPAVDEPLERIDTDFNTEAYDRIQDNPFIRVSQDPLSTFSIDVDTASYSNVRRFLNERMLPPPDSVRIEELVNYFGYDYAEPTGPDPFAVHLEVAQAPWDSRHQLVRIGLKGREIARDQRQPANLVFLLDVSGSMQPPNKLPLLKRALRLLVDNLEERDRVAIVVYAGASGLVLPSTECTRKEEILQALERLEAGGSTNGGEGLLLAYRIAQENRLSEGINRVILATDGDFNVGVTNQGDLTRLIEEKAKTGVFLTVLGFGMGNYKDSTLEKLADKGNGNYGYIDTLQEARKLLVEQVGGTLVTIAKDVKIQVEFNPAQAQAYRLIGYENRMLRHQDFNDDTKDAGEIGAGHTVTALYELVPHGVPIDIPGVDPLKYQTPTSPSPAASNEMLTVKLRYKKPQEESSRLLEIPLAGGKRNLDEASSDFRFAAAVASFGMLLRNSEYRGDASFEKVLVLAESALGEDQQGYRKEFVNLVRRARALAELEDLE